MTLLRKKMICSVCGDDLLSMFKTLLEALHHFEQMLKLASEVNEVKIHGLGLIAKKPATNYKRGNVLSRDIARLNGKSIILRTVKKSILTASMRSHKLTTDEVNYLAAIVLKNGGTEPLTDILAKKRLEMLSYLPRIDFDSVYK